MYTQSPDTTSLDARTTETPFSSSWQLWEGGAFSGFAGPFPSRRLPQPIGPSAPLPPSTTALNCSDLGTENVRPGRHGAGVEGRLQSPGLVWKDGGLEAPPGHDSSASFCQLTPSNTHANNSLVAGEWGESSSLYPVPPGAVGISSLPSGRIATPQNDDLGKAQGYTKAPSPPPMMMGTGQEVDDAMAASVKEARPGGAQTYGQLHPLHQSSCETSLFHEPPHSTFTWDLMMAKARPCRSICEAGRSMPFRLRGGSRDNIPEAPRTPESISVASSTSSRSYTPPERIIPKEQIHLRSWANEVPRSGSCLVSLGVAPVTIGREVPWLRLTQPTTPRKTRRRRASHGTLTPVRSLSSAREADAAISAAGPVVQGEWSAYQTPTRHLSFDDKC